MIKGPENLPYSLPRRYAKLKYLHIHLTLMNLPSSNRGKNCPESSRSIIWNSVPRQVGCTIVKASIIKLLTVKEKFET
jgi:hypothetical protein